jgi:hypothetical protein
MSLEDELPSIMKERLVKLKKIST